MKKTADQYSILDTAKLGDLTDEYYYGADCGVCGHLGGRLSLMKLRADLGSEFPLVDVRKRLWCEKCGKRRAIVTYWTPAHRGGSLTQLFDRNQSGRSYCAAFSRASRAIPIDLIRSIAENTRACIDCRNFGSAWSADC